MGWFGGWLILGLSYKKTSIHFCGSLGAQIWTQSLGVTGGAGLILSWSIGKPRSVRFNAPCGPGYRLQEFSRLHCPLFIDVADDVYHCKSQTKSEKKRIDNRMFMGKAHGLHTTVNKDTLKMWVEVAERRMTCLAHADGFQLDWSPVALPAKFHLGKLQSFPNQIYTALGWFPFPFPTEGHIHTYRSLLGRHDFDDTNGAVAGIQFVTAPLVRPPAVSFGMVNSGGNEPLPTLFYATLPLIIHKSCNSQIVQTT